MRTAMKRKAALPAAVLTTALLLTGCGGGGEPSAAEPTQSTTPSATATVSAVNDQELGAALSRLVFHGEQTSNNSDVGACLVTAVRQADFSQESLAYLVEAAGDHIGAVVAGLREIDPGDAEVLLSPQLREDFDACVDAEVRPGLEIEEIEHSSATAEGKNAEGKSADDAGNDTDSNSAPTYEAPEPAPATPPAEPPAKEANLEPRYEIGADENISSSAQLRDGLVSMFVSYAQSKEQRQIYQTAGECLAGVVLEADFSQETLRFVAGGAPIGTGEVADYLPNEQDKATWQSREFTGALVGCTLGATLEDA